MSTLGTTAVVFDLDGTLVDSEPNYFEASRRTLAAYGVMGSTWADQEKSVGISTRETVTLWRERYGLRAPVEELLAEKNRHYLELARADTGPLRAGRAVRDRTSRCRPDRPIRSGQGSRAASGVDQPVPAGPADADRASRSGRFGAGPALQRRRRDGSRSRCGVFRRVGGVGLGRWSGDRPRVGPGIPSPVGAFRLLPLPSGPSAVVSAPRAGGRRPSRVGGLGPRSL